MKFRLLLSSAAVLAVFTTPAFAQDAPPPFAIGAPEAEPEDDEPVPAFQTEEEELTESLAAEISEAFSIFDELFKPDPLTPEQEARLPLAEELSAIALPEGSLAPALKLTLAPMMEAIVSAEGLDKRSELSRLTGMDRDDLDALEDKAVDQALDIFDPDFEARTTIMVDLTNRMLTQFFEAMEPAYSEAIARAYAVRFSETELRDILAFAETESGRKYAEFGFLIQFDPQIAAAASAMGPAMAKALPDLIQEAISIEEKMPAAFSYIELAPLERETVAKLLGKSVSELEALAPVLDEFHDIEDDGVI
jgi:hypothetical protein